jgi:putative Mg2+ transporter-C (MgtC) family protein
MALRARTTAILPQQNARDALVTQSLGKMWRRLATPRTIMNLDVTDVALRLGTAALAGALIGLNRDLANKPIGMRTLGLVALGAAVTALAAVQVPGMAENADALSRVTQGVIQGVMAGISFIGAGVILRDARTRTVEGLTTAASVWVTAAVGLACGLAAWTTVGIAVVLTLLLLIAGKWLERIGELRSRLAVNVGNDDQAAR